MIDIDRQPRRYPGQFRRQRGFAARWTLTDCSCRSFPLGTRAAGQASESRHGDTSLRDQRTELWAVPLARTRSANASSRSRSGSPTSSSSSPTTRLAVRGYRLDRPAALPRRYAQALADELGHTVFLLGLDDDRWWAYRHDADEATSAFFVGLSRAAQRLIFTRRFGGPAGRPGPVHNGGGSGGGAGRRRACDAERTGCQRGSRVAPADPGARGRPGPAPGAAGDLDRRRC